MSRCGICPPSLIGTLDAARLVSAPIEYTNFSVWAAWSAVPD